VLLANKTFEARRGAVAGSIEHGRRLRLGGLIADRARPRRSRNDGADHGGNRLAAGRFHCQARPKEWPDRAGSGAGDAARSSLERDRARPVLHSSEFMQETDRMSTGSAAVHSSTGASAAPGGVGFIILCLIEDPHLPWWE
jgi:hypothetical protein